MNEPMICDEPKDLPSNPMDELLFADIKTEACDLFSDWIEKHDWSLRPFADWIEKHDWNLLFNSLQSTLKLSTLQSFSAFKR